MESLHIESFSYGWLSSRTSSKNSFVIEHADLLPLHDEFNFATSSSSVLVNADKIFSNGLLLPLNSDSKGLRRALSFDSLSESFHREDNHLEPSRFSCDVTTTCHIQYSDTSRSNLIRKCNSTRQKLHVLKSCARKYLCFFTPLREKVKRMRFILCRKAAKTSPVSNTEWSCGDMVAFNGEESSIYEAVLHCKRSFVCPAENAQLVTSA